MLPKKAGYRVLQSIAAVLLLGSVAPAGAATVWVTGVPTILYPLSDGSYSIGFSTALASCTSTGNGGSYVRITVDQNGVNATGAKNLIATALLAFSTETELQVAYDDSSTLCYVNRIALVK